MIKKLLCIYHANCVDGFTAAWAVRRRFGEAVEFHPGVYQQAPPDVTGRDVVLVDFSYKRAVMLEMAKVARSILVLDHHKSAAEDLHAGDGVVRIDQFTIPTAVSNWEDYCTVAGISQIYALFDMERSGAGIAWDFFNPNITRPMIVNHVEDRDLWRFKLERTRDISAAIFGYDYTFENWDLIAAAIEHNPAGFAIEGAAIERKHHKDIRELTRVCARTMIIAGHYVPVASLPYTLSSDAGHAMAIGEKFAACYWDTRTARIFSLRSADTGMDVSEIAKQYGGGGHARAAGFEVPRDHELARS